MKALDLFTAQPKLHNCAQAVSEALGHPDWVPVMQANGGGRAPGGLCGALYAAMQCVPESQREEIKKEFTARLGATLCRELKAQGASCAKCVETAEELALAALKKD